MADEWTFKELSASDTDEIYRIAQLEYAVFPDPWSEKEIKNGRPAGAVSRPDLHGPWESVTMAG